MKILTAILNFVRELFELLFHRGSGPKTGKARATKVDPKPLPPPKEEKGGPAWYKRGMDLRGLKEKPGPEHEEQILAMWDRIGLDQINDDETAWCAAAQCYCLEEAGERSPRAPNARSFLQWGKTLKGPKKGAIVVFWRVSKRSWQGHVGMVVKWDETHIWCLGGNQSNGYNISKYPRRKVLGYRWPSKGTNSRTMQASITAGAFQTASVVSKTILDSQTELFGISEAVKGMLPAFANAITVACLLVIVYARFSDLRDKGR